MEDYYETELLICVVVSNTREDAVVEEEASEVQQMGETRLAGIIAKRDLDYGTDYMGINSYWRKTKNLLLSLKWRLLISLLLALKLLGSSGGATQQRQQQKQQ